MKNKKQKSIIFSLSTLLVGGIGTSIITSCSPTPENKKNQENKQNTETNTSNLPSGLAETLKAELEKAKTKEEYESLVAKAQETNKKYEEAKSSLNTSTNLKAKASIQAKLEAANTPEKVEAVLNEIKETEINLNNAYNLINNISNEAKTTLQDELNSVDSLEKAKEVVLKIETQISKESATSEITKLPTNFNSNLAVELQQATTKEQYEEVLAKAQEANQKFNDAGTKINELPEASKNVFLAKLNTEEKLTLEQVNQLIQETVQFKEKLDTKTTEITTALSSEKNREKLLTDLNNATTPQEIEALTTRVNAINEKIQSLQPVLDTIPVVSDLGDSNDQGNNWDYLIKEDYNRAIETLKQELNQNIANAKETDGGNSLEQFDAVITLANAKKELVEKVNNNNNDKLKKHTGLINEIIKAKTQEEINTLKTKIETIKGSLVHLWNKYELELLQDEVKKGETWYVDGSVYKYQNFHELMNAIYKLTDPNEINNFRDNKIFFYYENIKFNTFLKSKNISAKAKEYFNNLMVQTQNWKDIEKLKPLVESYKEAYIAAEREINNLQNNETKKQELLGLLAETVTSKEVFVVESKLKTYQQKKEEITQLLASLDSGVIKTEFETRNNKQSVTDDELGVLIADLKEFKKITDESKKLLDDYKVYNANNQEKINELQTKFSQINSLELANKFINEYDDFRYVSTFKLFKDKFFYNIKINDAKQVEVAAYFNVIPERSVERFKISFQDVESKEVKEFDFVLWDGTVWLDTALYSRSYILTKGKVWQVFKLTLNGKEVKLIEKQSIQA